jgi:hypothetical protein
VGVLVIAAAISGNQAPAAGAAAPLADTGTPCPLSDYAGGSHAQWAILGLLLVGGLVFLLLPKRYAKEHSSH